MMKRVLPVLFLVPSVALILYAKRAQEPERVELRIRVDTGGFELPEGLELNVASGDGARAAVADGWARLSVPRSGPATVRLEVRDRSAAARRPGSVAIGLPREVDFDADVAEPTGSLSVTPDDCRAALAHLRR